MCPLKHAAVLMDLSGSHKVIPLDDENFGVRVRFLSKSLCSVCVMREKEREREHVHVFVCVYVFICVCGGGDVCVHAYVCGHVC